MVEKEEGKKEERNQASKDTLRRDKGDDGAKEDVKGGRSGGGEKGGDEEGKVKQVKEGK